MAKCEGCGKEVDEDELDRDGDCRACRFADRSNDMCVGDLGGR